MSKLWLMALYEYRRNVWQKKFLLSLFSVPLILGLMIGMIALSASLSQKSEAIGYVDQAGVLQDARPAPPPATSVHDPFPSKPVAVIAYRTPAEARQALEAGELQAYYVIPADYWQTNQVELVYLEPPTWNATRQFWDLMQINRLGDLPIEIAERAVAGSNLAIRWPADQAGAGRVFSQETFVNTLLPLFIAMGFVFMLLSTSGYLMGAVVEEKENRMMEVMITSLSPNQLMIGKVVGILGITVTLILGWAGAFALAVVVGGQWLDIGWLRALSVDLALLAKTALIAIPPFVMTAALMTAVGATVVEMQEAQQTTGLFMLPFMVPLWLIQPIMEHPDSPLVTALSLFPPTSVVTLSLRLAFDQVPTWQIATSIGIGSLCALAALWFAGRAFRLGMLRYGQRVNWRQLWPKRRPSDANVVMGEL